MYDGKYINKYTGLNSSGFKFYEILDYFETPDIYIISFIN